MQIRAFHGTNQAFKTFSLTPPHRNTQGVSADQGVFFTLRRETAEIYARMADRKFWPGSHDEFEENIRRIVTQAEHAMKVRDFKRGEDLYARAEQLEAAGRDSAGGLLYEVEIDARRPLVRADCGSLGLDEMAAYLAQAFADGCDAVVLEDYYEPVSGEVETQIVLRDPTRARIIARELVPDVEEGADLDGPSPF